MKHYYVVTLQLTQNTETHEHCLLVTDEPLQPSDYERTNVQWAQAYLGGDYLSDEQGFCTFYGAFGEDRASLTQGFRTERITETEYNTLSRLLTLRCFEGKILADDAEVQSYLDD